MVTVRDSVRVSVGIDRLLVALLRGLLWRPVVRVRVMDTVRALGRQDRHLLATAVGRLTEIRRLLTAVYCRGQATVRERFPSRSWIIRTYQVSSDQVFSDSIGSEAWKHLSPPVRAAGATITLYRPFRYHVARLCTLCRRDCLPIEAYRYCITVTSLWLEPRHRHI